VNEAEAFLLTGIEGLKNQLKAIRKMGAKKAIITCAEEGAGYSDGKQFLHIFSHKVKVVEVTGAGDTFGSSFVAGLIKKPGDLRFALTLAIVNAESVIGKVGAQAGLLSFDDALKKTRQPTTIKKI
jgi:sugar/nucleoside kinase (ribokinase family)